MLKKELSTVTDFDHIRIKRVRHPICNIFFKLGNIFETKISIAECVQQSGFVCPGKKLLVRHRLRRYTYLK